MADDFSAFADLPDSKSEPPDFGAFSDLPDAPKPSAIGRFATGALRGAHSAAANIGRDALIGAGGLVSLANQSAGDKVFSYADQVKKAADDAAAQDSQADQDSLPYKAGRIVGGAAETLPLIIADPAAAAAVGGGAGIGTAADVIQRGGSLPEAAKAGAVSGATNAALNLLPISSAGLVAKLAPNSARSARIGLTAAGDAAAQNIVNPAARTADNAALPDGDQYNDLRQDVFNVPADTAMGAAGGALASALHAPVPKSKSAPATSAEEEDLLNPEIPEDGPLPGPSGAAAAAEATKNAWMAGNGITRDAQGNFLARNGRVIDGENLDKIHSHLAEADLAAQQMEQQGIPVNQASLTDELIYRKGLTNLQNDLASAQTDAGRQIVQKQIDALTAARGDRAKAAQRAQAAADLRNLASKAADRGDADARAMYLTAADKLAKLQADPEPEAENVTLQTPEDKPPTSGIEVGEVTPDQAEVAGPANIPATDPNQVRGIEVGELDVPPAPAQGFAVNSEGIASGSRTDDGIVQSRARRMATMQALPHLTDDEVDVAARAANLHPDSVDRNTVSQLAHLMNTEPDTAQRLLDENPSTEKLAQAVAGHFNPEQAGNDGARGSAASSEDAPAGSGGERQQAGGPVGSETYGAAEAVPSVNAEHDIPLGGGKSSDGKTVYVDRGIPKHLTINGKRIDVHREIAAHENAEFPNIDRKGYSGAHDENGNSATRQSLIDQGLKTPTEQRAYDAALKPHLDAAQARAERGEATNIPINLDRRPYDQSKLGHLLPKRQKERKPQSQAKARTASEFADEHRRSLLNEIRKMGGIEQSEMPDVTGEGRRDRSGKMHTAVGGQIRALFRKNGVPLDRVVERMREMGYFAGHDADDTTGNLQEARDIIRAALNGDSESTLPEHAHAEHAELLADEQRTDEELRHQHEGRELAIQRSALQDEANIRLSDDDRADLAERHENDDDYFRALQEAVDAHRRAIGQDDASPTGDGAGEGSPAIDREVSSRAASEERSRASAEPPLELSAQDSPKAPAKEPSSLEAKDDLFGERPVVQQAIPDEQRRRDAKRNGVGEVSPGSDGGLFSDRQRQTDVENDLQFSRAPSEVRDLGFTLPNGKRFASVSRDDSGERYEYHDTEKSAATANPESQRDAATEALRSVRADPAKSVRAKVLARTDADVLKARTAFRLKAVGNVEAAEKVPQSKDRASLCYSSAAGPSGAGLGDMVIGRMEDAAGMRIWHAVVKLPNGTIYDPTMRTSFAPGIYEKANGFVSVRSLTPETVRAFLVEHDGLAPDAKNLGLTEDKNIDFSRSNEPRSSVDGTGRTAADVKAELVDRLGDRTINTLENSGKLSIHDHDQSSTLPDAVKGSGAAGAYYRRGGHLIANNIEPGQALGVLLHELGMHDSAVMRDGVLIHALGEDAGPLMERFERMKTAGGKLDQEFAAEAEQRADEEMRQRRAEGLSVTEGMRQNEMLAHFIQLVEGQRDGFMPTARKFVTDVVAKLRKWILNSPTFAKLAPDLRFKIAAKMSGADFALLAHGHLDSLTRGEREKVNGIAAPAFSRGDDPEPDSKRISGIKNAITDTERTVRGMPEAEKVAQRDFGIVWNDPKVGDRVATDELIDKLQTKPRAVTDTEDAMLLHRQIELQNQYHEASEAVVRAHDAGDAATALENRLRAARLSDDLLELLNVNRSVGTETARGLSARRMLADQDFNLAAMETRFREAAGGRQLTDPEKNRVREMNKRITSTQKALDDHLQDLADKARQQRASRTLDAIKRQLRTRIEALERQISSGIKDPQKGKSKTELDEEARKLQRQRDILKAEFNKLFPKAPMTDEQRLKIVKSNLEKRASIYNERVAKKLFEPIQRTQVALDEQGIALKVKAENAKRNFLKAAFAERLHQRGLSDQAQDALVKWRRGALLSSPATLGKLTAAALWRIIFTPAEELVGHLYSNVPGLSKISAKAPREGGGLNAAAEAKALTKGIMSGIKDAGTILTTGRSSLDALHGKEHLGSVPAARVIAKDATVRERLAGFADLAGALHAIIKNPVKKAEYERSLEKRSAFAIRNGLDPSDPMVQTRLMAQAYQDSQRAIFMQDNRVVQAFNMAIKRLEQPDKSGKVPAASKLGATALQTLFPIVKVPTNIAAEVFTHVVGSATGSITATRALARGVEKLSPEEAESIMRQLKKGSLGTAVMLTGYFAPQVFGGFYNEGDNKKLGLLRPGSAEIDGNVVPANLLHNPLIEAAQFGATIRRVADTKLRKKDTDNQGIGAGTEAALLGLADETPFVSEVRDIAKNPKYWDQLAESLVVPMGAAWAAKMMDQDVEERPRFLERTFDPSHTMMPRKTENTGQAIESVIPGVRETLPVDRKKLNMQRENRALQEQRLH